MREVGGYKKWLKIEGLYQPITLEPNESRLHYCAVVERSVTGRECLQKCVNLSTNETVCTPTRCRSPWRICRSCIKHQTIVPQSIVVDEKRGLCQLHIRYGTARKRIDVFSPPKETRQNLPKNVGAKSLFYKAIRLKLRREGLNTRELASETGISLDEVKRAFKRRPARGSTPSHL